MSASTVSITANPSRATRRRPIEKTPADFVDFAEPNNFTAPTISPAAENARITVGGDASIRAETTGATREAVVQVRKPLPSNGATQRRTSATPRKPSSKLVKPWWLTVISIFAKNFALLVVLLGLAQIIRQLMSKNGGVTTIPGVDLVPGDYKGNMEKVEEFIRSTAKTMKMMQVQVDVLDRKIGDQIGNAKREINKKIDGQGLELEAKMKELDGRTVNLEGFVGELGGKMEKWLSKDELNEFLEEFKKQSGDSMSLDEVRVFARGIVEREIEKHAADGLGRVDYALASAGGMVLKHSEVYTVGVSGGGGLISLTNRNKVNSEAEKMLRPSFGEPGQCFPLRGSSGFVQIRLRTAIIPEAVTLEHVTESVAYDRSSAPKNCRVSGWLQQDSADAEKMQLLSEFTYDLDKSNVQTFDVVDSARDSVVNLIKFEFTSNHGSRSHTCIYRLRVHGHEPNSVSMLTTQY